MTSWVNLDGWIEDQNSVDIGLSNRSFNYGDGLFESIRIIEGKIIGLELHLGRLLFGARFLEIRLSKHISTAITLEKSILELAAKNQVKNGKVKLIVFRKEGGLYTPDENDSHFILHVKELAGKPFSFSLKGLQLGVFEDLLKPINTLSSIKSTSSVFFVKAGLAKKKTVFDELIVLNNLKNVCEAISSNIFCVVNGAVYTPPLSSGCLPGTMRAQVIQLLHSKGMVLHELDFDLAFVQNSDEVFLTNAIHGIQWVSGFGLKRYYCSKTKEISLMLNESLGV
ncbi:MAG: aminotransferase class IV [Flavobacteriales bacterium]|nr:aminotransferase class IV [Flavobacteriales bacterium]